MNHETNDRVTVKLDAPIRRGETILEAIDLRRPLAGELRGTSIFAIARMETDALVTVLPRVTQPPLIEHEVLKLDAADLMQCGLVLSGFCMPRVLQALDATPES